jgi:zinc transport system substrate-binding protein
VLGSLIMVSWIGCSGESDPGPVNSPVPDEEPLVVYAVHDPLAWLAEGIGRDQVLVHFPAPEGIEPDRWFPEAEIVARYQQADLVLRNGAGYAAWIDRATLPQKLLIDTCKGFRDRWIPRAGQRVHNHGPEGDHSHTGFASMFWLDPGLAEAQARAVHDAFVDERPEHAAAYAAGLAEIEAELRGLDARLRAVADRLADAPILFSHPVYAYFERAYGLNGRSLDWEPEVPPSEAQWQGLETLRADHPARLMIWEGAPTAGTKRRLEALGIESVVLAPSANPGSGPRYATALASAVRALETAVRDGARFRQVEASPRR